MALPSNCNSSSCTAQITAKHRGICPAGWHIPTNAEWDELLRYVDSENEGDGDDSDGLYNSYTAGKYLKAKSGWFKNGNGIDKYGFAALPGSIAKPDGYFYDVEINGRGRGAWWSTSEYNVNSAYGRIMSYDDDNFSWVIGDKAALLSVRCVRD